MDEKLTLSGEDLAGLPGFGELDIAALHALAASVSVRTLARGDALFRHGDDYKKALFIVYEGRLELRRATGEVVIRDPGAVVGLSNYLDNTKYRSSAIAILPSRVLKLDASEVSMLEAQHPALFDFINRIIAERLRVRAAASGQAAAGALSSSVASAMKSPLSTCSPEVTLKEAFQLMQERRIGSLGVLGTDNALLGILTCSGFSESVMLKGISPDDNIMNAACQVPHTIAPDAPLWQADDQLQRYGVKYLVVMDGGTPVGMLSQTDILRALISAQIPLTDRVMATDTINELAGYYAEIFRAARQLNEQTRRASPAVRMVSEIHLAIQRRCVELTLEEMNARGLGGAPRSYAVLIMGSGGRREMMLNPDQDNGIIIADDGSALSTEEDLWFTRFAEQLNVNLDEIGYILCPGDIMARNPMFRKTLSQWKDQISHLARKPSQKAARWSNIVFDFETLYGDDALTRSLRNHLLEELQQRQTLLEFMVEDDAEGRPPLGFFNQLITADDEERRGRIDIKRNGLRIIADAARIYALSTGIATCNTSERLRALIRQGVLGPDLIESVDTAYEELLDLLLEHQVSQQEAGVPLDKLIAPDELTPEARGVLRLAMRAVKRFQGKLQGRFGRSAF